MYTRELSALKLPHYDTKKSTQPHSDALLHIFTVDCGKNQRHRNYFFYSKILVYVRALARFVTCTILILNMEFPLKYFSKRILLHCAHARTENTARNFTAWNFTSKSIKMHEKSITIWFGHGNHRSKLHNKYCPNLHELLCPLLLRKTI